MSATFSRSILAGIPTSAERLDAFLEKLLVRRLDNQSALPTDHKSVATRVPELTGWTIIVRWIPIALGVRRARHTQVPRLLCSTNMLCQRHPHSSRETSKRCAEKWLGRQADRKLQPMLNDQLRFKQVKYTPPKEIKGSIVSVLMFYTGTRDT